LGAGKTDAQTGRPLAGAVFAFRFDSANNGAYDGDLGECTTGPTGICQPPVRNTSGGWLPGWYQVTEVQAPPGYWLDPTTSVQHVFLRPGADVAASVSFADDLLGSLQLEKTGNDAKYWPVSGAVFSVAGPAPSQATVGTLDVGNGGTTNTITGLVPGTYHVAETTAPPGYGPVPPFSVMVPAGHATTEASVTDPIRTGSITVTKTDAATGAPLAGATFDTWFDSQDDGSFDVDLGTCTTDGSGTCAPRPNDGTSYLPGRYRVTEVSAPAGYALPVPPPSQTVVVDPSGSADFTFTDHRLVPAAFTKVATGNFNPTELVLSGAVLDITTGSTYGGPVVATCTTSTSGRCTTAATLVSGGAYCWLETVAPPGLNSGASGCFTASNTQRTQPLTVTDPGTFVAVAARKVDSANPSTSLPGAVLDLYRVDGGHDASPPTPPAGAADEPGQTWVSRASTESDGVAQFPLQLPGYAYCVVEEQAPADYVADSAEHCTPVLTGSPHVPPPVVTLTVPDTEARVTVSAHKYNSATPGTGIPGAVYDLYVEGQGPPSGPPSAPPQGAVVVPGDRWWTRGTTNADGRLDFSVPAGASWCLKEVSAPVDYTLDSGLHCTERVVTTSPAAALRIALPETTALVTIYTHKFNSARPATTIPGAAYELVGMGSPPAGWSRPANPSDYPVPPGDWYVGTATTGRSGVASWSVPAGRSWCLHEVHAPPGYRVDFAWHCTGIVTTISTPRDETVALPELPLPAVPVPGPRTRAASALLPTLPFTGGPGIGQVVGGVVLALAGGLLLLGTRRRVGGSRAGEATGTVPGPTPHGS
ncbi:MAG: MSCRAMM family protein, partial [Acidimicrobiales bacterium]